MPVDPGGIATVLSHVSSLRNSSWEPQSPSNPSYNCFAWAARESDFWVEPPGTAPFACWPGDLPDWLTVNNYARAYAKLGFEDCETPDLEVGIEKIAIFGDKDDMATHAARQLPTGRWTSKWGRSIDFEHDLDTLDGDPAVGKISRVMQRPLPSPPPPPPPGLSIVEELGEEPECIFD